MGGPHVRHQGLRDELGGGPPQMSHRPAGETDTPRTTALQRFHRNCHPSSLDLLVIPAMLSGEREFCNR